jgi:hypothetical protein
MTTKPQDDVEHVEVSKTFAGKSYRTYDYITMWKHIGITYQCKSCPEEYWNEKECRKHITKAHPEIEQDED